MPSGENAGDLLSPRPTEAKPKRTGIRGISKRFIPLVLAGANVVGGDAPPKNQNDLPAPIVTPGTVVQPPPGSLNIEIPPARPSPQEAPSATARPEVKDLKSDIEKKYNVKIDNATKEDLSRLDRVLEGIPTNFLTEVDGKKVSIKFIVDGGQAQISDDDIILTKSDLTAKNKVFGVEINRAYLKIAGKGVSKIDNRLKDQNGNTNVVSNTIMETLGGKEFQNDPGSVIPFFKNKPQGKEDQYVRNVFIDPKTGKVRLPKEVVRKLTETWESGVDNFRLIGDRLGVEKYEVLENVMVNIFFENRTFWVNENGIPHPVLDNLQVS